MYFLKLINITRRGLLPRTCQSTRNVRARVSSVTWEMAARVRVERRTRGKGRTRERERGKRRHDGKAEKIQRSTRHASFHRATVDRGEARLIRRAIVIQPSPTPSPYISQDCAILLSLLSLFLPSRVSHSPHAVLPEFQKRHFMRSLFNLPSRPFVIVDSARARFHSSAAIAR